MVDIKNNYPFELDSFQEEAIQAVEKNHSVLVSAPTGAGKTVIAEYVMTKCLKQGQGVIYTAPIKALSNQKFREFSILFPDQVGIVTGDVNINANAPLVIMTTEIFRNRLLESRQPFQDYSWIIFDEIHYLDDMERGTVWEESLIFLPHHMRILGLSATIPNVDDFALWLEEIYPHPIEVIKEVQRPVPLHFFFQCTGKITDQLNTLKRLGFSRRKVSTFNDNDDSQQNRPMTLVKHLLRSGRIPCIYFAFSRKRCEYLAAKACRYDFLLEDEQQRIIDTYDRLADHFGVTGSDRSETIRDLVKHGIAYHHAGLHPMLKEIIEQLFSKKMIKMIFTTETFALGINMPARTVVIDEMRKKYGRFFRAIKTRDFFQMAGRSGRRGIDNEGFVYSRINQKDITFQEILNVVNSRPEPIHSRFNASYGTILNLYEAFGEELFHVYQLSFHHFMAQKSSRKAQIRQMRSKLNLLKQLEYIKDHQLTPKGHFAKKMYGYELTLAELYATGVLEELTPIQLGILALAVVYEPRPGRGKPKLSKDLKFLRTLTSKVVRTLHKHEKNRAINPQSKRFYYDMTNSIVAWMMEVPFEKIIEAIQDDEGEVIRYYRMSIQVLREMLETPLSKELKGKIYRAIQLINRDVIDAENQLRLSAEETIDHPLPDANPNHTPAPDNLSS